MATLKKAKDDGHFFILAGRSEGTFQIKPEGQKWLAQQIGSLLLLSMSNTLDISQYRYLKGHNYLYRKNEGDNSQNGPIDYAPSASDLEIKAGGPPLLLYVKEGHELMTYETRPWILSLKIDEIDETGQSVLRQKRAIAIGTSPTSDSSSTTQLRGIGNPANWPEVAPQSGNFALYYQNNGGGWFRLSETTSAPGLHDDWRGNVFCKFEENSRYPPLFINTWQRKLANTSIAIDKCTTLYWLAKTGFDPEWPDPAQAQCIDAPQDGWQLWSLQTKNDNVFWDAVKLWLWYRQITLTYPQWHFRLLNPLQLMPPNAFSYTSMQPLLLRCDPPKSSPIDRQTQITVESEKNSNDRKSIQLFSSSHDTTYLRCSNLKIGDTYSFYVQGLANRRLLCVSLVDNTTSFLPAWLQHGLCCNLIADQKPFSFKMESFRPHVEPKQYQLLVPDHFTLKDLASLTWNIAPSGIPVTLRWQYGSCKDAFSSQSSDSLTAYWQDSIWPAISVSSQVDLTLDAASFGRIHFKLLLKPARVVEQHWWDDAHIVANFLWLSNLAGQETMRTHQIVSPAFQKQLRQLYQPDIPTVLKTALQRLSSRPSLPAWIYNRLNALLTNLYSNENVGMREIVVSSMEGKINDNVS